MCEGSGGPCATDADCTELPHGFCQVGYSDGFPYCECSYGCTTDAECGAGKICLCGGAIGKCVPATCTSDADCASGLCASYNDYSIDYNCGMTRFACQSLADECASHLDCPGEGLLCLYQNGRRVCGDEDCVIGM
jgi:hypothetical protein